MPRIDPSRRRFLRLAGLGGAAVVVPRVAAPLGAAPPPLVRRVDQADDVLELAMAAVIDQVTLRPGEPTTVWRYEASVTAGDPARLQAVDGPFPGPIVRVRRGMRLRVQFTNRLRENTTVHWHGMNVPSAMDGHPSAAVAPGDAFTYEYEVRNPPGTYWFHPHPHGRTGAQVYKGLAGVLIVEEEADDPRLAALSARAGGALAEAVLIVQDRTLDADNQLAYAPSMMGFLGDDVWVNGHAHARLDVAQGVVRLRVLNGSNHRIYKLGWRDGAPLTVVGTDGGLLDAPVDKPYAMLGPGERIELLADLRALQPGAERALDSLAFRDDSMGIGAALPQGAATQVATLRVAAGAATGRGRVWLPVGFVGRGGPHPPTPSPKSGGGGGSAPFGEAATASSYCLVSGSPPRPLDLPLPQTWGRGSGGEGLLADPIPADRTIALRLERGVFTLNGRTYEMDAVADDEIVKLGAEEVWAFVNEGAMAGPGMGMTMAGSHVMHLHLVRFRVVERSHDGRFADAYASVAEGLVDEGWKDTVLVMPGETVKIRATFGDFAGMYLYHCHMLEHEDQGMMRNFRVDA